MGVGFALVACARWETPYIVEWLLYHRAIGFEHVYLYCNDDHPAELYAAVMPFLGGATPFVTFTHYPFQGQQFQMYLHALRHYRERAEWLMFLDIDEFLLLRHHATIRSFVAELPPAWDSVNFNWMFFGNNGFRERPAGSVLLQYTRRQARLHPFTKNLTRTARIHMGALEGGYRANFWHFWEAGLGAHMRCVNVLGDDIRAYYQDFPAAADAYLADADRQRRILDTALIHHYHLKSEQDFALRTARGLGGDFYAQGAWMSLQHNGGAPDHLRMVNEVEDRSLASFWQAQLDGWQQHGLPPPPPGANLALGRPATQSSISQWSTGRTIAEDAALVTNGLITGTQVCHTDLDEGAWWRVDLGVSARVTEVRIYNRVGHPILLERLTPFAIDLSDDDVTWQVLHEKRDPAPVGGVDGAPYILRLEGARCGRFLRIRLLRTEYLHLDQVEVYGSLLSG